MGYPGTTPATSGGIGTSLRAPHERSGFPAAAIDWLTGTGGLVLSMAPRHLADDALATALHLAGHDVVTSTGPLPFPARSLDNIVCSRRVPDLDTAARILKPGGRLTVVHHLRDHRIPWARRFDELLAGYAPRPPADLALWPRFGFVEETTFRYWQPVDARALADLARAETAGLDPRAQAGVLAAAQRLYDDYARGPEGLRVPWLCRCYRATLIDPVSETSGLTDLPTESMPPIRDEPERDSFVFHPAEDAEDDALVLINFP